MIRLKLEITVIFLTISLSISSLQSNPNSYPTLLTHHGIGLFFKIPRKRTESLTFFLVSRQEVDTINMHYNNLVGLNDKIDRSRFRDMLADIFGVDDSLIMDRGRR